MANRKKVQDCVELSAVCWARSPGKWTKSHLTLNGKLTLCGMAIPGGPSDVGWSEAEQADCQRCLARHSTNGLKSTPVSAEVEDEAVDDGKPVIELDVKRAERAAAQKAASSPEAASRGESAADGLDSLEWLKANPQEALRQLEGVQGERFGRVLKHLIPLDDEGVVGLMLHLPDLRGRGVSRQCLVDLLSSPNKRVREGTLVLISREKNVWT